MRPVIKKWFNDAGFSSLRMYEVHSKNVDKNKEFQAFKDDTEEGIKLCLSVNMVAEGIHGDINGVIMLRETISPNFYFQMIGRAFACGKKTIPLIFDLVANSQFISETADNFPNELRGEIERQKKKCEKEGKDYEVGFDIDEFIIMDQFMDVVSGFREIEGRLKGKKWTEEENNILREYYPVEGSKVADRLSGRTKGAIRSQAEKLGIIRKNLNWTESEDAILEKYYVREKGNVYKRLRGRSKSACITHAQILGIAEKKHDRLWTGKDDEILSNKYPVIGTKVAEELHRTRYACVSRAKELGIKYNAGSNKHKYIEYRCGKWRVGFWVDGKRRSFGSYDSEEEAVKVAIEKAKEYGKRIE